MPQPPTDNWPRDILRASLVVVLYVAGIVVGIRRSFLYGGGVFDASPLLLAFFAGPWAAAWVSCKCIPSYNPRMAMRLGVGIFAGVFSWWLALGIVNALIPGPIGDPRAQFVERHDFALVVVPFFVFLTAGVLAFSRWKKPFGLARFD